MADGMGDLWNTIVDRFKRLPDEPTQHQEQNPVVRDAHFYAGVFYHECDEQWRILLGDEFVPMPWYRCRAACTSAVLATKARIKASWRGAPRVYTMEDVKRVWHWLHEAMYEGYCTQYSQFYHRLRFWNPDVLG